MTQFGTWLKDERARISANDVDLRELVSDPGRLTRYTRAYLALTRFSLDDALGQVPSMDAEEADSRHQWEEGREGFIESLTESVLRIAHLLVAMGCSDKELAERYEKLLPSLVMEEVPDAPQGLSVPEEERSDSDESGTLCADAPELVDVAEK